MVPIHMGTSQRLGFDHIFILYTGSFIISSAKARLYLHPATTGQTSNPLSRRHNSFSILRSNQGRIRLLGLDLLDDTSRVSSHDMESRDIFGHHTSSANRHASTDGDTWTDCYISTKPAIFANCDGTSEFRSVDSISEKGIERVGSSEEGTAWTDESAGSYGDDGGIEECAVEVDVNSFADSGSMSTWQGKAMLWTDLPEIGSIVDFDGPINVCIVLKERSFFLLSGSVLWHWSFVINDTEHMSALSLQMLLYGLCYSCTAGQ